MSRSRAVPPFHDQPLHRHADLRLVVFLGGQITETTFEGRRQFVRGDFVFRPAHFGHADRAGPAGALYAGLAVSGAAARNWFRRHGWRAARGHTAICERMNGDVLLDCALPDAWETVSPSSDMERAATWMADATLRPLEIAARLRMAPYELTRRFRAAFGVSPNTYRRQARLQRAIALLCGDAGTLANIAVDAGFFDQSHLTLELRREIGCTPSGLRAMLQAG